MSARHVPCGVAVNESERQATERLKNKLPAGWLLLSNVNHSFSATRLSDEIDLIAIGPPGVTVIEVKHWDLDYLKKEPSRAEAEAERIATKAKRIAGNVRSSIDAGFISPAILLTRGGTGISGGQRFKVRGVPVFGLSEWADLTNVNGPARLSPSQIEQVARLIEPRARLAVAGDLRRFGDLINLERLDSPDAPFHRVYRGQHISRRDKVILHLFDLSASDSKHAENLARREFEVIQRWQKSDYVPLLLDSFQEAEQFPGELFYFTLVDPAAPTLRERVRDATWTMLERLDYATRALEALDEFHCPRDPDSQPLIHRNISPDTLRVRLNNRPLFTGFGLSRIGGVHTISTSSVALPQEDWIAPEVRWGGLAAADARSDVYSLCKSLLLLFDGDQPSAQEARQWLTLGCAELPEQREKLSEIAAVLRRNTSPSAGTQRAPSLPLPQYWDEDTIVPFNRSRYRVINRLGRGGMGQTFKVVELSPENDEQFGTYVAKVIDKQQDGEQALRAYRRARQFTTHPNLSALHEIAAEWRADSFVALLKWIDGIPLIDLRGVLELQAEELSEPSTEAMVIRWLIALCDALWQFHAAGFVHGDVSPTNIIVRGGDVVLTDYDTVTAIGESPRARNPLYASDRVQENRPTAPSDDIFALAASFFHVIFDRDPFVYGTERRRDKGLNLEGIDTSHWSRLLKFLVRATAPDPGLRFEDAREARQFLLQDSVPPEGEGIEPSGAAPLSPQTVPRLRQLLSAYPGSPHGNLETRGLDSQFSEETYVETALDAILQREVRDGVVDLIVLFGNAGDGKTAFLQRLAQAVTGDRPSSQQRVWERRLSSGRILRVNLDGSASFRGKSANAVLDSFLAPFITGDAMQPRNSTHALAINSGKMLEWLEESAADSPFLDRLRAELFDVDYEAHAAPSTRFRLIDLNRRSLVGGFDSRARELRTDFLNALLDRLLGEDGPADPWAPCRRCSAQARCSAWHSVKVLRDGDLGRRVRERLAEAFQACHLRGEIHITARELRAALVFILFGIHDCQDLHDDVELRPARYWDRAFASIGPAAEGRQGELLAELACMDPALDSNPILDRHLLRQISASGSEPSTEQLASARRRAFFEWADRDFAEMKLPPDALTMHGARHLRRFRSAPTMTDEERQQLCRDLCLGIARLEDLPDVAFRSPGLPLRVTPRTPTESAFWVVKPWERFSVSAPLPKTIDGVEVMHTHVVLKYRYATGQEERLPIGLELFHLLLDLKDGAQLAGVAYEGVFAHLDLFVQRIAQEDVREMHAWHPEQEDRVSTLRIELRDGIRVLVRSEA